MLAQLPPEVRRMLEAPNFASLATVRADGSPHVTPMWVDLDTDHLLMNTAEGRVKLAHVRRDPRVAVCVFDAERPYSWAEILGKVVELRHEGAVGDINRLSRKYLGWDYPLPEGMVRVTMIIEPEDLRFAIREAPGR